MRSILVVEDNTLVYETISDAFAVEGGFAVAHAADGYAALAALETRPDLALIDIGLPGVSGITIARRAVELAVPAVLMSGYADLGGISGAELFPVIEKPFRVAALARQFDEVVAEALRLNRIMREQIEWGTELVTRAKRSRRDLSETWLRICSKLL